MVDVVVVVEAVVLVVDGSSRSISNRHTAVVNYTVVVEVKEGSYSCNTCMRNSSNRSRFSRYICSSSGRQIIYINRDYEQTTRC